MSSVTNLILTFCGSEKQPEVDSFLNKFPNEGKLFKITSIDDPTLPEGWYGGTKYMESKIYLGAYNHFNYLNFIDYIKKFSWEYPEEVQLLIKGPWDEIFKSFTI